MKAKTLFALSLLLLSSCLFTPATCYRKKKCPKILGVALFVCPTDYKGYCSYFTGEGCDSKICARLTANSCTACSDVDNVAYYTEHTCKADKVFCDDYARPQNCTQNNDAVCAYYSSDDCTGGVCSQTARNPCEACGSPFAEYYKPGKCSEPSQYTCDARNLPDGKKNESGPVCAFFTEGCPIDLCSRTVSSASKACQDSTVLHYKLGKCENEVSDCATVKALGSKCALDYHPVCASLQDCTGPDCTNPTKTFDNDCAACSASGYKYFVSGVCDADRSECPAKDIVKDLPQNGTVCAFFDGSRQTYDSAYLACSQTTPDYYIQGPCSFNCDEVWTKFNRLPCIGLPLSPVCGYYTEGCSNSDGVCEESFTNSCYGCSTGKLGKFTDGLCPQNSSLFCESGVTPGSCAVIEPVCGIFEEDCNHSSCRQTFQNPCQVCEDPTVLSYTPGLCPGDKGVPCDASNRPTEKSCSDAVTTGPVCGATRKNCNHDSCRTTYDNSCLACADHSVVLFNNGECPA